MTFIKFDNGVTVTSPDDVTMDKDGFVHMIEAEININGQRYAAADVTIEVDHGVTHHAKVKYLDEAIQIVAWEKRRPDNQGFKPISLDDGEGNLVMDGALLTIRAADHNDVHDLT